MSLFIATDFIAAKITIILIAKEKNIAHSAFQFISSALFLLFLQSNVMKMSNARQILNNEEDHRVVEAIRQAELNTSGEIKVHIENHCRGDVEERSLFVFNRLKLNETKLRNGVLIYLAVKDRKFAILGDEGINNVVEDGFWNDVKDLMQSRFKESRFAEGLEEGIMRCGEKLKTFFPYQTNDINEISDEISYENN